MTSFLLTPIDHTNPDVFAFYYLSFRTSSPGKAIESLHAGISQLTSHFPFLTGEMVPSMKLPGVKNAWEVRPSTMASGTELPMLQIKRHPEYAIPMSSVPGSSSTSIEPLKAASLDDSYNPLPMFLPPTQPRPILRFQANILADGIILTMAFNHMVFDGTGGGIILQFLSESCQAVVNPERINAPFSTSGNSEAMLRNRLLEANSPLAKNIIFSDVYGQSAITGEQSNGDGAHFEPKHLRQERFMIPGEKIQKLKLVCNRLLPWLQRSFPSGNGENASFLSGNDILTALIWRSIAKARSLQDTSDCLMAVNLRSSFKPPLPTTYMGNTVTQLRMTVSPSTWALDIPVPVEPLNGLDVYSVLPLAQLAYRIRHKLNSMDSEYAHNLLAFIKSNEDWKSVNVRPADIIVTSWRHLKVYKLEFGPSLGRIDRFENQPVLVEGVCVVMPVYSLCPRPPWDIRITLDEKTLGNLKEDNLWCWALDVEQPTKTVN